MAHKLEPAPTNDKMDYYSTQKKFWAFFAPFYDIVVKPISRLRERVVTFADAPKGTRILDIATGTGKQAFVFASKGYNVIGIDLSEAMLRIANRKNRYKNLKFEVANAAYLPFKAMTFDVSCISFALHEMPLAIREKVLQEMVRVTKLNGTIMIIDFALPENKIGRFFIYHLIKLFEGEHYAKFIKADLKTSIERANIVIQEELPVLLRAARILKCIKRTEDR